MMTSTYDVTIQVGWRALFRVTRKRGSDYSIAFWLIVSLVNSISSYKYYHL